MSIILLLFEQQSTLLGQLCWVEVKRVEEFLAISPWSWWHHQRDEKFAAWLQCRGKKFWWLQLRNLNLHTECET
jgi:hypothetical protein